MQSTPMQSTPMQSTPIQTWAIAKREAGSLFSSPVTYVAIALFSFGMSMFFVLNFAPGRPAELRDTYFFLVWLLIFLVPAISMRLLSEEFRTGTIEPLMTAPVRDEQVIIGKWIGAMFFLAGMFLPMLVPIIILEATGNPDLGPILTGLVGLLLVGGLYLAIGMFASACTDNQLVAWMISVAIIGMLTFAMFFLPSAQFVGPNVREALFYLNVNQQYEDFSKGLIDTSNFIYFLTLTIFFLFLSVRVMDLRRWW